MPEQLRTIGEGASSHTLLSRVSLPDTIIEIEIGTFSYDNLELLSPWEHAIKDQYRYFSPN